jgi:hypothetical protein
MQRAKSDAAPIIAELVAADQPVSWLEDELCRRMGQALADQTAHIRALRNEGRLRDFDRYTPEQLLNTIAEAVAAAATEAVAGVDDPDQRSSTWRLVLAVARVMPHYPDVSVPVRVIEELRKSVPSFPQASIDTEPTGTAQWCRDVYGTRFGITAPFPAADGADR